MKLKAVGIILILFSAGFIGCDSGGESSSSSTDYKFTESFEEEYQAVSIRTLQVSTINGQIKITGWEDDVISVNGLKKANNQEDLGTVDLEVTKDNNKIIFDIIHETDQLGISIDLDLMVPSDIIIEEIDSLNGKVEVMGMSLIYDTQTTNGEINLEISEIDGDIDLGSVNGKIDVYILTSMNATIDMSTVNGNITTNDVPLNLTINAPKHLRGDLGVGGDIILISTVNGDIELHRLNHRFTDMGDGTIRDNDTGLIWLKNANCLGRMNWFNAMDEAVLLADGECGLADESAAGDWRIPTKEEWEAFYSLVYDTPALVNTVGDGHWSEGDAFTGVQSDYYWSSTEYSSVVAWFVNMTYGYLYFGDFHLPSKSYSLYVWPVRSDN